MGIYDNDDEGYDDFENRGRNSGGGGLRAQLEDALKKLDEANKVNAKLQRQVNTTTLRDVLQEKGLRPGLARAMTKDGVDASDAKAVADWLADPHNQEDFAFSLDGAGSGTPAAQQDAPETNSEAAAQFRAFMQAQNNALPADPSKVASAAKLMESASTDEEILAALAAAR